MRDSDAGSRHDGKSARRGAEVLIEFQRLGNCVKVTAVDPVTMTEVSIMGPPSCGQESLARGAMKKLHYVLAKRAAGAGPRRAGQV